MGLSSFSKNFLLLFFSSLFFLILAFKAFPDAGLTDALNVTLNFPANNYIINTKNVNFTFNVEWNGSIVIKNCTLFGNFTGEWTANETNQTEIVEGENGIYLTNLEDGVYKWNVYCYNETDVYDYAETNRTVIIDAVSPFYLTGCSNLNQVGATYYLISDITSSTNCIQFLANNIILDCQGHTINGTAGYGILIENRQNNTIKNCTITEFENGIYLESSSNNTLTNNKMSNNVYNFRIGGSQISHFYQDINTSNTVDNKPIYYWVNKKDGEIDGDAGLVILISCENITVKNLVLSKNFYGISVLNTSNSKILNNTVNSSYEGIILGFYSSNNIIENNSVISNNWNGIALYYSMNNSILNNNASLNTYSVGIYLETSTNNTLTNNIANSNHDGIYLYSSSNNNTLTNNIANSNGAYGIALVLSSSKNFLINNNASSNNNNGIHLYSSSTNNTLVSNTANSNDYDGIAVYTSYNTLEGNVANFNNKGILISSGSYNVLTNNIANSNNKGTYKYGVHLYLSNNNSLINTTANLNSRGIYLENSSSNNILNSTFINNNNSVHLKSANNNTIHSNKIQDSENYGIYLESDSQTNKIYNNLFNNTNNFYFSGAVYSNSWNTTRQAGTRIYSAGTEIGGNYWTNSNGNGYSDICIDADKDGFCDAPLILDPGQTGNNTDYIPLSTKYQVSTPPPTSQPPSGGTGAPTTTVTTTPGKAIIFIPLIAAMSKANVSIQKTEGIDFTQIAISVRNKVTSVQINVTKLDVKPEEVPALVNIYRYIKVDIKNIHDENITEVKIRFRVQKSWINSNNIKVESIALYRYTNRWEKLNTVKIGEDSEEVYFEATSPGLSYFAIAGEKGKQNCPYECCIGETDYYDKTCASGYKCENHVCVPITVPCTEDWICTDWSECIEGKQTRLCTDRKNCGTVVNKPEEEKICEIKPEEKLPVLIFWLGIVIIIIAIIIIARMIAKKTKPVEKPKEEKKVKKKKA